MLPQFGLTLLALDISANFLVSLPPSLASCTCLEELNVSANPLRVIPEFLAHLPTLRLLLADSTGIATIPSSLSALERLHTLGIRRNRLHALPSWLCTLPCLENLLIDGNPFKGPWSLLVEPLLESNTENSMHRPSMPMVAQLSTSSSKTSDTITVEGSSIVDSEDYATMDQQDASLTRTTIHRSQVSPPISFTTTRGKSTLNRNYYEHERESQAELPAASVRTAGSVAESKVWNTNATTPGSPNMRIPSHIRDLRRMRSADEFRRSLRNLFSEPTNREDKDVDAASPSRPISRARAATTTSVFRGSSDKGEQNAAQPLARAGYEEAEKGKEKERTTRKWGFLRKISLSKLRPSDGASQPMFPPSRLSASSGTVSLNLTRPIQTYSLDSREPSPRESEAVRLASDPIRAPFITVSSPAPFFFASHNVSQNVPVHEVKAVSPSRQSSSSFSPLLTPSIMHKTLARQSFLPIDGSQPLNTPVPGTNPSFSKTGSLYGLGETYTSHVEVVGRTSEMQTERQQNEEEHKREARIRALRSVMAYLKDMNDLTLPCQGRVFSKFDSSSAPVIDHSERYMKSETSINSTGSGSSAPTVVSSDLFSVDSLIWNRPGRGSLSTTSIATTVSSGIDGDVQKCNDDHGKRLTVIREIIE